MSSLKLQGLYYSYFKTVAEAPTLLDGLSQLYSNNVTEYPSTINTLKRFNLYPEVALGSLHRLLRSYDLVTQSCYRVDRGPELGPVQSCVGLADQACFYVAAVWAVAGVTTFALFLLSAELRSHHSSILK